MAETLVLHLPNTIMVTTLLSAWFLRLVTRSSLLGQMSGTGLWASNAPRPVPPTFWYAGTKYYLCLGNLRSLHKGSVKGARTTQKETQTVVYTFHILGI